MYRGIFGQLERSAHENTLKHTRKTWGCDSNDVWSFYGVGVAIAVDSIEPGDASDPEYLDRVINRAIRFSLGDAETKTLDLQLATGL